MDEDPETSPHITQEIKTDAVDNARLRNIAAFAARHLGVAHFELDVTIVDAETMTRLNFEHRGLNTSTDVLSFPQTNFETPLQVGNTPSLSPNGGPPQVLGDVIISYDDAVANATRIGQSTDHEMAFLLIHGILHLCGHDHKDENQEKAMLTEQRQLMLLLETAGLLA